MIIFAAKTAECEPRKQMFNEKLLIMLTCDCPAPASLPDIPCVECPERFGQIQKVAFQRLRDDNGSPNSFPKSGGVDSITDLANWQSAMTAADSTKIVISPYLYSPTQESGAPRTFGGGNDSLNGVEEIIGRELSAFTASARNCPQSVIFALKKMQCEGSLGVYLFDQYGNVECIVDEDGNAYPIPIKSLFVGDKVHGGIDNPDTNVIQWSFVKNYSDDLHIFVLETFNPLTDFCGGASPEPPTPSAAYVPNVAAIQNLIPNTAKKIVFEHGSGGAITSGYTLQGYLDNEEKIEVWYNSDREWYLILSTSQIYAPESCESMFEHYESLESAEFKNFNTINTTTMYNMFAHCFVLASVDLSDFNTENVVYMPMMFADCRALTALDLSHFNTASLANTAYMFNECVSLHTLNLSNFDMSNVERAFYMFWGCSSLTTIIATDWNLATADTDLMFQGCTQLVGGNGTHYNSSHTNGVYARVDRAGTPGYFTAIP